jgi:hypothetical protein
MAHESFENAATAALMNDLFVNIKVDREERPDLDSIYMQAVQAMTGQGGWPMTMFLTPEGVPFHGGTYFPPADRHGMPAFSRVLKAVAAAYREQQGRVADTAQALRRMYEEASKPPTESRLPDARVLELAYRELSRRYDFRHGGFDGAPKFPPTMALEFLLTYWRRTGSDDALRMARDTFVRMARGGIHDQVGGGFARYSVDARWIVPHFEKMLYDNALIIRLGAHLWQAMRDEEVRGVTEQTIAWAAREMLSPEGGFHSSLDADSESEEGLFYTWTVDEFNEVLGDDAAVMREYFGVTATGNFEGRNILLRSSHEDVVAARAGITAEQFAATVERASAALLARREQRVRPGRDDKIILSWNGLMVRALADAAVAFDNEKYAELSLRCAEFLFTGMTGQATLMDGGAGISVMRTFSRGQARIAGFLEDYASLGLAALAAHQLSLDRIWLERARALAAGCVDRFWEATGPADSGRGHDGAFFDTDRNAEPLVSRPRDITDNATPSGMSLALELLLLSADHFDDTGKRELALAALGTLTDSLAKFPTGFGHALCAADVVVHGTVQIALVGSPAAEQMLELRRVIGTRFVPGLVLAGSDADESGDHAFAARRQLRGPATAYLCRRFVCDEPTSSPERLAEQLEAAVRAASGPTEKSSSA